MTREDLFKAMDAIPDELLLRSEGRALSEEGAADKVRQLRRKRIPMMLMSSAALGIAAGILFVVMAGPVLNGIRTPGAGGAPVASAPAVDEEQADSFVAVAQEEAQPQTNLLPPQAEEEAAEIEEAAEAAPQESVEDAQTGVEAGADTALAEGAAEETAAAETEARTSADLLGDMGEDYTKVEFITAEELANGEAPTEPAYSEEGEEALSRAINEGTPGISLSGVKAKPLYYIYLTKIDGEKEEVVIYEGGYVTLSSMSGMYMKVPDEVLAEVEKYLIH